MLLRVYHPFAEGTPSWRKVFACLIYPASFLGGMFALYAMIGQGVDPKLGTGIVSVVVALVVIASERIQPHAEVWSRSHDDVPTDVAHMLLSEVLPPQLVEALLRLPLLAAAGWLSASLGSTLWPGGWPLVAQICLAMIVSEFGQYWWHRLAHEHEWFWRFHATHHSSPRLYWLNAGRFHPLETMISYSLNTAPLILMGAPLEIIAYFTVWTAIHGMFQHSNIELRLGPLNYIFSMAELHRWHHSRSQRDQNANYGGNVIFWDLIFGTFHYPTDREHDPLDVGFEGDEHFPQTYAAQLKTVFAYPTGETADPSEETP